MMEINKDSVCLRCAHLKTISVEDWYSHTLAVDDAARSRMIQELLMEYLKGETK